MLELHAIRPTRMADTASVKQENSRVAQGEYVKNEKS